MSKILIISTAHDALGNTGNKTGVWLEELAEPYYTLTDAGHEVAIASIGGAPIPIDPNSEPEQDDSSEAARRFKGDNAAMALLQAPANLSDQKAAEYDAVFIPGGHGAVWDLASSEEVAVTLAKAWEAEKIIASVCHGPAALVGVEVQGRPLVQGMKVSAFTDAEEKAMGLEEVVPFLLETRLRELGAEFQPGDNFQPKAVADGRLITGQNPSSSKEVASLLADRLG
ncbi:type 1 glutamine amidotransferase domain-containing protein [Lutimaribacter marinistellae]|uniref:Type 1 glutamine amidotransferase domain-containing protein n=1 Tax=Lutimaribacter marinistellae TaxID=1820329 RepID=A0ABV7TAG6_9RHOB